MDASPDDKTQLYVWNRDSVTADRRDGKIANVSTNRNRSMSKSKRLETWRDGDGGGGGAGLNLKEHYIESRTRVALTG